MRRWRREYRCAVVVGLAVWVLLAAGVHSAPTQPQAKTDADFGVELQIGHVLDTRQGHEAAFAISKPTLPSRNANNANSDAKNAVKSDFTEGLVSTEEFTRLSASPDAARTQLADTFARTLRFPTGTANPNGSHGPDVMLIERETVFKQSLEAGDSPVPDLQMFSLSGINPSLSDFAYAQAKGGGQGKVKHLIGQGTAVRDAVVNAGDYVALYRDENNKDSENGEKGVQGNSRNVPRALGVFALRSEIDTGLGNWQTLLLHTTLKTTLQGATLTFGYNLPLQFLPEGTRFRQTFLLMRARPSAATPDYFTQMQRRFGLDGSSPTYTATMETGAITSARFPLDLAAADGATVFDLAQADLPCDLPVRVSGLRANWTTVCANLPANSKAVPLAPGVLPHGPLAAFDGAACIALDLNARARRLFLGHPAICDRPDVGLNITAWDPKGLTVQLHNPTAQPITVHLRIHPRLGFGRQTLHLPARASIIKVLSWQ